MLVDIVILPPARLREKIGKKIKAATKGVPATFVVDNKKLIPHLSLFHMQISKLRLAKLFPVVEKIAHHYRPINISSVEARLSPSGSSICYYTLTKPKQLWKLHQEVIRKCRGLRTGTVPWNLKTPPTGYNLEYRRKYGSQHILKNFKPHFTLARIENPKYVPKILSKLAMQFKFTAYEIYICKVDKWLQVYKILKTFRVS